MKKATALFLVLTITVLIFSSCTKLNDVTGENETTTSTTTETTTVTTTEDVNTTFKENSTSKIYPALKRDSSGDYSYKIATYTTKYASSNETRTTNIKESIAKLDNLVIPNDSVFSFNQTVGKRTVAAGYEEAKVVKDGEFVDGLGGGVCQVSSTIFEAILRANLKVVSRAAHSVEIGYVPLGGDATVQWNSTDFQFKNNSGTDIRLSLKASSGTLTCTVYAKDDIDVGDVSIKITKKDDVYTLKRTVNGEVNYTTKSKYKKAKATQ